MMMTIDLDEELFCVFCFIQFIIDWTFSLLPLDLKLIQHVHANKYINNIMFTRLAKYDHVRWHKFNCYWLINEKLMVTNSISWMYFAVNVYRRFNDQKQNNLPFQLHRCYYQEHHNFQYGWQLRQVFPYHVADGDKRQPGIQIFQRNNSEKEETKSQNKSKQGKICQQLLFKSNWSWLKIKCMLSVNISRVVHVALNSSRLETLFLPQKQYKMLTINCELKDENPKAMLTQSSMESTFQLK